MEERTCYNCANHHLCFIRRKMETLIHECLHFFDVDRKGETPGFWQDLLVTLANVCKSYEYEKEV